MSSYIFYEPFYFEVNSLLNDPSLLQQGKAARSGTNRSFKPRLDLHEDKENNIVTATLELPGVSKDDVQLNFQNGKLTVSAEIKKSEEHADDGYALRERLHGKFMRTLQLPQGVQGEQIKATMENGLLTVTFPKTLPELAPKKIVVSQL
ncbi:small heat shock protein [Phlegmacium glaucopus]|nr:small heat shock protein [Phlegmacium glaucopus]